MSENQTIPLKDMDGENKSSAAVNDVPEGMEGLKERNYMVVRNETLRKWGKCLSSFICCGDSWGFRYSMTFDNKVVMEAAEVDSFCKTLCCGLHRSWWIDVKTPEADPVKQMDAKPVFSIDRKFRPVSPWFCGCLPLGMLWCCCEHQAVNVFDRSQKKIGSIRQIFRFFHPEYEVTDETGLVVYRITGPICKLECFDMLEFPITDPKGQQVAGIVTGDKPGCCGHIYDKDNY